jgi:LemA protein
VNGTGTLAAVASAVLLFWVVGAYNRLVGLRGAIPRRFAAVHEQYCVRHALLIQQIEALEPVMSHAAPRLEALRAACGQLDAACAHAKVRPGAAGAIASLRLADEILTDARARLPAAGAPGLDLTELNARLGASDATLAFARGQFNDAVVEYNRAVTEYPTALLVRLFGFRGAATL